MQQESSSCGKKWQPSAYISSYGDLTSLQIRKYIHNFVSEPGALAASAKLHEVRSKQTRSGQMPRPRAGDGYGGSYNRRERISRMPRAWLAEIHVGKLGESSRERETPRGKLVASGIERGGGVATQRETPRGKLVASGIERGSGIATQRETPRGKLVASGIEVAARCSLCSTKQARGIWN